MKLGPVFFDLGESYPRRKPVLSVLEEKLPASLLLEALALIIQTVLGTLIGVIAAYRKNTKLDWGSSPRRSSASARPRSSPASCCSKFSGPATSAGSPSTATETPIRNTSTTRCFRR